MRRAPSSRNRQGDGLRNSVFDAARSIGLADPNALRWLEQNANISEEDEEEDELKREPRPPSDAHPPSLVFSTSSSEPDSSVHSPSNDHSTNFRTPYRPVGKPQYQPYGQSQFPSQASQPLSQLQADPRAPVDPNTRNSPNPLGRPPPPSLGLKIPDPWPPSQLAIASLSPSPSPSRAPTPADTIHSKQAAEPRKARKLTKAPRTESEPEIVPPRKVSAGGESTSSGTGGIPPMLPVLPFPTAISGEALSSDASVSGLSAISGSSSSTVTQPTIVLPDQGAQSILFPLTPIVNEPRSVFEDDNDDQGPTFSTIPASSTTVTTSNHTHNSPSTSTAASAEALNTTSNGKGGKESKNGILRAVRSFKLSLKGQKAPKIPLPEAPPVPTVPALPPVLTLKLGKDAGAEFAKGLQSETGAGGKSTDDKGREVRSFQIGEIFQMPESVEPTKLPAPVAQPQYSEPNIRSDMSRVAPDLGAGGPDSDLGHAPIRVAGGGGGFWSADLGAKKAWTSQPSKAGKSRRMSVDEAAGTAEPVKETAKATERTRAGTVGTRSGHARTRSKSGDFSGAGWEKNGRPPMPKAAKGPKPTKVKRVANPDPISPKLSFDSNTRHSLERDGFGARGELDEIRALDVQHQLQSFVASMRTIGGEDADEDVQGGFSRASEESFDRHIGPRGKGDDADTLRSSGEYDPDPFRSAGPSARSITTPLPRPESEAIPHQLIIPAHSIPKELGQTSASTSKKAVPPSAFKYSESGSPAVQASTSSRPSIVVGVPGEQTAPANKSQSRREGESRPASQESELGLGYSGFGFARSTSDVPAPVDNDASEEWVVPSPSWAPLDPKRGRSPAPDAALEPPQPKFLEVRPERQRASGLSIPRSVTPDSPRPLPSPVQTRNVIPLAGSKSPIPLATPGPAASPVSGPTTPLVGVRPAFVPLVARSLTPQPRAESPSLGRESMSPNRPGVLSSRQVLPAEGRNTPSPPVSRRALPARTSSISSVSSGEQSFGHGSRVRSPPPRIIVPVPVPGPRSAQPALAARSMTSTPIARSATSTPVPRSMSTTPTPRTGEEEQPLRHEAFSRFLAPETVPAAQKRGRVSPFPTRPVRERTESQDHISTAANGPKTSLEAPEETQPSQREKFPGGVDRYGPDGLMQAPRVRFIGVRSSNGSSQADWQGRMEDMRKEGPPTRTGSWIEYEEDSARPVSWESGLAYDEDPTDVSYDDTAQRLERATRYSDYTEETREGRVRRAMSPETTSNTSALPPSEPRYPGWAVDAPASRASTFTVASVYDDEEPIPPVPNTQKLAATIRGMGMGQSTWARGRI
ncbi:hypothetical protein RhiLY_08990 [Ceratobasidium sp. AG-Ba]|nr:hypothetical protein RhiLY_08990 [Ceratobasidium sp. AG-Ba]